MHFIGHQPFLYREFYYAILSLSYQINGGEASGNWQGMLTRDQVEEVERAGGTRVEDMSNCLVGVYQV